jgi:hypothetical protein
MLVGCCSGVVPLTILGRLDQLTRRARRRHAISYNQKLARTIRDTQNLTKQQS